MGKELLQKSKDCVPTNCYTLPSLAGLPATCTMVLCSEACCVGGEQVNHDQQTSVHPEEH